MLSSVDGKIDGALLAAITRPGEYEETGSSLNGDAWICGRTTMHSTSRIRRFSSPLLPPRLDRSRCMSRSEPSLTPLRGYGG